MNEVHRLDTLVVIDIRLAVPADEWMTFAARIRNS